MLGQIWKRKTFEGAVPVLVLIQKSLFGNMMPVWKLQKRILEIVPDSSQHSHDVAW